MKKNAILLFILLAGKMAMAQLAVTNTGTLYISGSSDIFTTSGDFTNNSGSALTNNGQLHVKGNLSNSQSSMAIGTGTLYLDGSTAQTLSGSQQYRTWHLNTNNAANITINNNLSVSGVHTFVAGDIITSATPNFLVYEAGSSYTGDGDAKHVNGWVKKFGTTNFTFPIGNGTVERTVAISNLSITGEFSAKYLTNAPNPNAVQTPLWDIDYPEYWSVQKASGGTAKVTLNWDNSKVHFPNYIITDILVAGYTGSFWASNGGTAVGTAATTGTITSNSISSFNLFTFGSQSYILPLTLINFNARRTDNHTDITWVTDKESNIDHFIVERSDDGSSFYPIGQLPAHNNSNIEQYNTTDNATVHGVAYYRLRIIDVSGRESFSKTVKVTTISTDRLVVLTNPVHDNITLVASPLLNGKFNYAISAMNGQLMQQGKLVIQSGGSYQLPLKQNILAGTYMLELNSGLENFRFKLIVH